MAIHLRFWASPRLLQLAASGFSETCWAMVNSLHSGLEIDLSGFDTLGDSVVFEGDTLTETNGVCLLFDWSAGLMAPIAAAVKQRAVPIRPVRTST